MFENLLGSKNVYFQPPEKSRIQYPCIIYNFSNIKQRHADNAPYSTNKRYRVTYVDKNPDNIIVDKIATLPKCSMDNAMIIDTLYHYEFTLYS